MTSQSIDGHREFQSLLSRIWNESWLASLFYKPCNYELFVKQSLNMEMAIVMARILAWTGSSILTLRSWCQDSRSSTY
ncbi:hypothetical protein QN277_010459 [Acacia crassicarpa]|uniref:Uncharacterized protein n=1 Tax=Acacia crassicarpa TaxID=499986 RepID=A0AAE1JLT5_9FABA|nr:hypothetical protein QN277_010459 [Acacia crassicarpa]